MANRSRLPREPGSSSPERVTGRIAKAAVRGSRRSWETESASSNGKASGARSGESEGGAGADRRLSRLAACQDPLKQTAPGTHLPGATPQPHATQPLAPCTASDGTGAASGDRCGRREASPGERVILGSLMANLVIMTADELKALNSLERQLARRTARQQPLVRLILSTFVH